MMRLSNLNEMINGWFVGGFTPTMFDTGSCEVAVKRYTAGEREDRHHHKIATEITVVVSGVIRMNGVEYGENQILVLEPNESTDFLSVTDSITVVVKMPGALNDKYID